MDRALLGIICECGCDTFRFIVEVNRTDWGKEILQCTGCGDRLIEFNTPYADMYDRWEEVPAR